VHPSTASKTATACGHAKELVGRVVLVLASQAVKVSRLDLTQELVSVPLTRGLTSSLSRQWEPFDVPRLKRHDPSNDGRSLAV